MLGTVLSSRSEVPGAERAPWVSERADGERAHASVGLAGPVEAVELMREHDAFLTKGVLANPS